MLSKQITKMSQFVMSVQRIQTTFNNYMHIFSDIFTNLIQSIKKQLVQSTDPEVD